MKKFIIDASALINLENNLPEDIFPSVHELCYDMFENNTLFSVKAVFGELKDSQKKWENHKDKFRELSEEESSKLDSILRDKRFKTFVDHGLKNNNGEEWADPHLIVCALINKDITIVSDESSIKHPMRKIPYVCDECGILCINFLIF